MAEGSSKLSEEQIYECLKSLNVPVRMNDLKVPSKEFIVRVFECFIKDLQTDVTGHELRTWEATKHFEEAEIYEEAICFTLLAMIVNHITKPIGLNVTIKDIVEPKPKRTKKILNYLLVFWNYYLQKCVHFHTIQEAFEEERKKADCLITENESLEDRYQDKLNILNSMQPKKEELSGIVAVEEEKESKLKMESDSVLTEYQGLKTKEANLRNEISATDVRIITAKQTIEELEQLILSSPDRINTEIHKLEDKIRVQDLKIKEFENKYKDAEKRLKLLDDFKIEEENDAKALDKLDETVNQLGETVKGIVSCHQKIEENEDKLKRLQLDVDRKEQSKLQQEHKSAKIALSGRKQIDILQEVLDMNLKEETSLKQSVESIKAAVNEVQNRIDSEENNILSIITKYKEASEKRKERKNLYLTKMKEIAANFESDCDEVLNAVREQFPYNLEENLDGMP